MSIVVRRTSSPRRMVAEAIPAELVLKMLNHLEPWGSFVPDYGEIADAIARASNEDPLLPDRVDGCFRTACILVALARHESSFHKTLVTRGRAFGLYQLTPPHPSCSANMLNSPFAASLIAIDLIRTSFATARHQPWEARLGWLLASDGCSGQVDVIKKSMTRMMTAERLAHSFRVEFPRLLPPPTPKEK